MLIFLKEKDIQKQTSKNEIVEYQGDFEEHEDENKKEEAKVKMDT